MFAQINITWTKTQNKNTSSPNVGSWRELHTQRSILLMAGSSWPGCLRAAVSHRVSFLVHADWER